MQGDAKGAENMKRRSIAGLAGIFIGAALLSGCVKTPESSLVKQKGKSAMENYKEGEPLGQDSSEDGEAESGTSDANGAAENGTSGENGAAKSGTSGENGASENDTSGENGAAESGTSGENGTSESNTMVGVSANGSAAADTGEKNLLRERLEAPEHYTSTVQDATGKLQILTDAAVEIPNAGKVSSIVVTQHPFDQEMVDRITDAFFPEAVFYDSMNINQMTKAEYQARLEELKGYEAEGNLDPYHYGTDENGEYYFDIQLAIESAQQGYDAAPEERVLEPVHPQIGEDGNFLGVAETPDGSFYDYRLKSYAGMPMEVQILKKNSLIEFGENYTWSGYRNMKPYYPELPDEESLKAEIGISPEEAKNLADEKVAALGLSDMELAAWEYALQWKEDSDSLKNGDGGYSRERQTNSGYRLCYTRRLSGLPITFTESYGGGLETMDSEMETWSYERLEFYVTKDGIDRVELVNVYDIGETKTENLELLPFSEIIQTYEKMMEVQNADVLNYENYRKYHIDRITFGYSRIYEPSADSRTGLLVPVWDFFGSFETEMESDGQTYHNVNDMAYQSYMTINAVDGSVIDREFGY